MGGGAHGEPSGALSPRGCPLDLTNTPPGHPPPTPSHDPPADNIGRPLGREISTQVKSGGVLDHYLRHLSDSFTTVCESIHLSNVTSSVHLCF
jgi:hypothetical protein